MSKTDSEPSNSLDEVPISYEDILDYFPYDNVRDCQDDGMQIAAEAVSNNGYFVLEGECGTGKTLLSLSPLLALVNSPQTQYNQIVVVTSVKQQIQAFQDELERINEGANKNVSALTLVGKSDVCPYVYQEEIGDQEIYSECERLRDNTRRLADAGESDAIAVYQELFGAAETDGNQQYTDSGVFNYAYPSDVPEDSETDYCPYYAQYLADKIDAGEEVEASDVAPQSLLDGGVMAQGDLLHEVSQYGSCPHAVMSDLITEVDVVIGNYYHLFEPLTVKRMTGDLLSDDTLVVIDEAHNLVPRVRDQLSTELTANTIQNAQGEAKDLRLLMNTSTDLLQQAKGEEIDTLRERVDWDPSLEDEDVDQIKTLKNHIANGESIASDASEFAEAVTATQELLADMDASERKELNELVGKWETLLEDLEEVVDQLVQESLEDEFGMEWMDVDDDSKEIKTSLRDDPSETGEDRISQWASLIPDGERVLKSGEFVGGFISQLYEYLIEEVFEERSQADSQFETVGFVMQRWMDCDHTQYYRELQLEDRGYTTDSFYLGWQNEFKATLKLHNCIPREEIASVLEKFGGGVLMSATLAPLDVFADEVGLSVLEEEHDRPVYKQHYGLNFPPENRDSFIVPAEKFKYNNKGQAFDYRNQPNTSNDVRQTYWDTCKSVVQETPGNVLISMPSYQEAKWVGQLLKNDATVDVSPSDVIIDKSSSSAITEEFKSQFFKGGKKVLITGAHGTLVEGVDYKGEKLKATVVCGVPIENTSSNLSSAIQAAYEDAFGEDNGFEYAFVVPAVRKSRQSIGRVIRTDDDTGIRALVDERYSPDHVGWDSVVDYMPEEFFDEAQVVEPEHIKNKVQGFWKFQGEY